MATTLSRELERLTDSGLHLADPAMDLRDREVIDRHGERVGKVSDVLLDPTECQVRMVEVETNAGVLGIGRKHHLIPVETLSGGDPRTVYVDRSREEVLDTPSYEPADGDAEEEHYLTIYHAYGVPPYWEASHQPESATRRGL